MKSNSLAGRLKYQALEKKGGAVLRSDSPIFLLPNDSLAKSPTLRSQRRTSNQ